MNREYALALVALGAAAGGLLIATGQDWTAGATPESQGVAGSGRAGATDQASPLAAAVGWASLAALAAVLATKGWARRAVGVLVSLFGAVAVVDIWRGARAVNNSTGTGTGTATDTAVSLVPLWPAIGIASGVALLLLGAVTVARGAAWPAMSSRYDRHGTAAELPGDDPGALWNAFSSGADPTDERAGGKDTPEEKER